MYVDILKTYINQVSVSVSPSVAQNWPKDSQIANLIYDDRGQICVVLPEIAYNTEQVFLNRLAVIEIVAKDIRNGKRSNQASGSLPKITMQYTLSKHNKKACQAVCGLAADSHY